MGLAITIHDQLLQELSVSLWSCINQPPVIKALT